MNLDTDLFFHYARERHSIYLRRQAGMRPPWTDDPILRQYKVTNVFRELDKTTVWLRENVRDRLAGDPAVLLATVYFRWFCRIETGQVLFQQPRLLNHADVAHPTAWDIYLRSGSCNATKAALRSAYPRGPYVTGAYMILSPPGLSKLDGVCRMLEDFYRESQWRRAAAWLLAHPDRQSMYRTTQWLMKTWGLGAFLAYEVVCDLRYTDLLRHAPDRLTWANVGPGARRGLNRMMNRPGNRAHPWNSSIRDDEAQEAMREILRRSRDPSNWSPNWPKWEMREVEMWLCEHDKIMRAKLNEGRPKQRYPGGG